MKQGKHPGRIRERLAKLLLEKGIIVSPYDLWTQEGGYRSHYWDLARWGSNHARWVNGITPDGKPYHLEFNLSSWSTMTECVRWGIEIGPDGNGYNDWSSVSVEHAKQP